MSGHLPVVGYRFSMVLGCLLLAACGQSAKSASPPGTASAAGESGEGGERSSAGESSGGAMSGSSNEGGSDASGPCTEGAQFCLDGNVYVCTANGELTLSLVCAGGQCEAPEAGAAACVGVSCQPGLSICQNNVLFVCGLNAETEAGVDCGDDVCHEGECREKFCTPGQRLCDGNTVTFCVAEGAATSPIDVCALGTRCEESTDGASCVYQSCTPGVVTCVDDKLGPCSEDGFELAEVTLDCAAEGELCDRVNEQCAPTLSESLPGISNASPADIVTIYGNTLVVEASRTLTQLEFNLDVDEVSDVAWLVYARYNDTYSLVFEQQAQLQPGSGYVGTTLDLQLNAGRRYLVALYTGNLVGSVYSTPSPTTRNLSFGEVLGGSGVGGLDYHEDYLYDPILDPYDVRLTTAPAVP